MKFAIKGKIRGGAQFSMEIEAKSERHAKALAVIKIGSAQGLSKGNIIIDSVEKVGGSN